MTALEKILALAKSHPSRIVLAEGDDPRVVAAACRAAQDGLAQLAVVAQPERFAALAQNHPAADQIVCHDPAQSSKLDDYIACYLELRQHKGVTPDKARQAMLDPLGFAAMMVRQGDADGSIGGAVATTSDTVRAALQIIGKAPDSALVSSFFLMLLTPDKPVVFADCGLVIEPDAAQLAQIAISSARSFTALTGQTPRVAMLAFSTLGSAQHACLTPVIEAVKLAKDLDPSLIIDGEIQFDAAFNSDIAQRKAPDSPLQGAANVFVFPNLHAGNIGYKIAQRIGGATALGPVLQGLNRPANDLSRGCHADDIYHMIAITAAQAAQEAQP